jgi:hypothetical protein
MFCVLCWKIKMTKTLTAGSAGLRVATRFSQDQAQQEGSCWKNCFFEKGSLQPLGFGAKELINRFFLRKFSAVVIIALS